jgi:hypothetical protein
MFNKLEKLLEIVRDEQLTKEQIEENREFLPHLEVLIKFLCKYDDVRIDCKVSVDEIGEQENDKATHRAAH